MLRPTTQSWLSATELPRAGLEMTSLAAAAPFLGLSPRGDDHPVVVIPGFLASDDSTRILREYLSFLGYDVYRWGQGRNLGATRMGGYEALVNHVLSIFRKTGKQVSLVGWSLGGIHALAVADRAHFAVRQLVTMGSPINQGGETTAILNSLRSTARQLNGQIISTPGGKSFGLNHPIDAIPDKLPITAIFSRGDGVVPWQRSIIVDGPSRDNIEVYGSHIGLGFNPSVLFAVADRLAQPTQLFKPFHRNGWRALTYPNPTS